MDECTQNGLMLLREPQRSGNSTGREAVGPLLTRFGGSCLPKTNTVICLKSWGSVRKGGGEWRTNKSSGRGEKSEVKGEAGADGWPAKSLPEDASVFTTFTFKAL